MSTFGTLHIKDQKVEVESLEFSQEMGDDGLECSLWAYCEDSAFRGENTEVQFYCESFVIPEVESLSEAIGKEFKISKDDLFTVMIFDHADTDEVRLRVEKGEAGKVILRFTGFAQLGKLGADFRNAAFTATAQIELSQS
jgi:hypothetical protein